MQNTASLIIDAIFDIVNVTNYGKDQEGCIFYEEIMVHLCMRVSVVWMWKG